MVSFAQLVQISLYAATEGGGVLINSGTGASPLLTEYDSSGTSISASVSLPYRATYDEPGEFVSINNSQFGQIQKTQTPDLSVILAGPFPLPSLGNSAKQKAVKIGKIDEVLESWGTPQQTETPGCTGLDKSVAVPALMVPLGGSNKFKLKLKRGRARLEASTPNTLQISPIALDPSNEYQEITVTGLATTSKAPVDITIVDNITGQPLSARRIAVDVLPSRQRTVRMFDVIAPSLVPAYIPTDQSLKTEFDRIFLRQANLNITVIPPVTVNFSYDVNPIDGMLQFAYKPVAPGQTQGCRSDVYRQGRSQCVVQPDPWCQNDTELPALWCNVEQNFPKSSLDIIDVYYVKSISKATTLGASVTGKSNFPVIIRGSLAKNAENVTSHEVGHVVNLDHNPRGNTYLMYWQNVDSRPCKITSTEWRTIK